MSTAGNHDMLMGSTLPVATDASRMSLGFKDDGKLYKTTSAGVETEIGGAGAGVSSLAKSGSTGQTGAVTLSEGSGVTITQTSGNLEIASTGGGGGMSNPMTNVGDVIVGGTSGAAERFGIGSSGQVLTVSGGTPAWETPSGGGGGGSSISSAQFYLDSPQTFTSNTPATVAFAGTHWDTGSYTDGSHADRILIATTGVYRLTWSMYWAYIGSAWVGQSAVQKNGTSYFAPIDYDCVAGDTESSATNLHLGGAVIVSLTASDYLQLYGNTLGQTVNLEHAKFTIERLS